MNARVDRRRFGGAVAILAVALIAPAGAGAATTVGSTFNPAGSSCSANSLILETASPSSLYAAPTDGVLTSWSFQAGSSQVPNLKLVVGRATTNPDEFFIVGQSDVKTPLAGETATYSDISITVQAGDFLGTRTSTFGDCGNLAGGAGYVSRYSSSDPASGTTLGIPALATDDIRLDVSATLEADLDGDGLGDETEDADDDGDGRVDASDSCAAIAAGTASGCPFVGRTLSLKYRAAKHRFSGKLGASAPECRAAQKVRVYRRQPGPDKRLGTATTTPAGAYSLARNAGKGKYYATAALRVVNDVAECGAAKSPVLTRR